MIRSAMLSGAGFRARVWLVAAALVLLGAAMACEPGFEVEYQNATSQWVSIYKEGALAFSLEPHETKATVGFEEDWRPNIKVVGEDGRVLLEDHITLDELEKVGYKIVITDEAHLLSPTPLRDLSPTPGEGLSPAPGSPTPPTELTATPPPAACWGQGSVSPLAPNPPSNLRAELASNPMVLEGLIVELEWNDNADDELCYLVERKLDEEDWSVYERVRGPNDDPVSLLDVPTEAGVHCYRITYGNDEGLSPYSNEACVEVEIAPVVLTRTPYPITPIPVSIYATPRPWPCNLGDDPPYSDLAPSPPTGLVAVVEPQLDPLGGYHIRLHWQLEGPDPLCSIVQRLEHDGVWRVFAEPGVGGWLGSLDTYPEHGVRCYRVAAANEHGRSEWSNEVCANGPTIVLPVTLTPTPPPTLPAAGTGP